MAAILGACAVPKDTAYVDDTGGAEEREASGKSISSSDASTLISDARTELGTYGGQCKVWVQDTVAWSYGVTIPSTDSSPASDQYKWNEDSTATNVARWLGSYANGRITIASLTKGASSSTTVSVPNGDPQSISVYASKTTVTTTMTKGSSSLSVTSTGGAGGTISSSTTTGTGTWTVTTRNTSTTTTASNIVVVVLSNSRFKSDWETARAGDIMQMYVGTSSSSRGTAGPHTTFVQTDYNTNGSTSSGGSCSGSGTGITYNTGCNWLDSNWVATETVGAHNVSMNMMMLMTAYSSSYGFTIYRLN